LSNVLFIIINAARDDGKVTFDDDGGDDAHRLLVEGDVVGEEEHRRRRSDEAFSCMCFGYYLWKYMKRFFIIVIVENVIFVWD
jgi:hypothetical protein